MLNFFIYNVYKTGRANKTSAQIDCQKTGLFAQKVSLFYIYPASKLKTDDMAL